MICETPSVEFWQLQPNQTGREVRMKRSKVGEKNRGWLQENSSAINSGIVGDIDHLYFLYLFPRMIISKLSFLKTINVYCPQTKFYTQKLLWSF